MVDRVDLVDFRDTLQGHLSDTGNDEWSDVELEQALRMAVGELSAVLPVSVQVDIDLAADGWEIDISSLTDVVGIEKVWYEFDESDHEYPPIPRRYEWWPDQEKIWLQVSDEPQTDDELRIFYMQSWTIKDLDGEAATNFLAYRDFLLYECGAVYACENRVVNAIGGIHVSGYTPVHWKEEAVRRRRTFQRSLYGVVASEAARVSGPVSMDG